MGWFGLPRDTQEEYIFTFCPGAKTSLTAQSPSPVPQEAPTRVFQKFSPAAQAADSGLYGSHSVMPAVTRDNEARRCGYRRVFPPKQGLLPLWANSQT